MRNWILVPVLAIALVAAVVIFVNADETRMPNETGLIDFDSVIDARKRRNSRAALKARPIHSLQQHTIWKNTTVIGECIAKVRQLG